MGKNGQKSTRKLAKYVAGSQADKMFQGRRSDKYCQKLWIEQVKTKPEKKSPI